MSKPPSEIELLWGTADSHFQHDPSDPIIDSPPLCRSKAEADTLLRILNELAQEVDE